MIYAVSFLVLLGILVFVHELGHFIFAKIFKVKVEIFSLGFGKAFIKKQFGETLYQIAIVPLGGFVKLYGQDPNDEVEENLKNRAFRFQALHKRFLIVFAGPLFNILLSILLFSLINFIGSETISSKISDLRHGSPAYTASLKEGDIITHVNNEKLYDWETLNKLISKQESEVVTLTVNNNKNVDVKLSKLLSTNKFGQTIKEPKIDGINFFSLSTLIGVSNENSQAYKFGFRTSDLIVEINDEPIYKWSDLEAKLASLYESRIKVKVKRNDSYIELYINLRDLNEVSIGKNNTNINFENDEVSILNSLGFYPAELFVSGFTKDKSPAKDIGILENDRIVSINNEVVRRHEQLQNLVDYYARADGNLVITVERKGEFLNFTIIPEAMNIDTHNVGIKSSRFLLGIQTFFLPGPVDKIFVKETNLIKAFYQGFIKTLDWIVLTLLGFWNLISGSVSLKALGGPLMLGKVAGDSMSLGLVYFFKILAIISINLGLINLFPIPVLDGGHIFFYGIEFITRKPLKEKYINIAQQFGFYVLIGLMLIAFYNDILRYSEIVLNLFK